jgi:phosphate starvation-inducible PhoH-like protein
MNDLESWNEELGHPVLKQSLYKHLRKENMAYKRKNRKVSHEVKESTSFSTFDIPTEKVEKPIKFVKPMTKGQEEYIIAIADNSVVLCFGPSGTGKTSVATMLACQYLAEGKIKKILISRPIVGASVKTLGALPGDMSQKFDPYLLPIVEQINKYFGPFKAKEYLTNGIIESMPLELLRGRTFDDTFMILDEAQNAQFEQLQMFLTRIGQNSKLVINGDFEQTDLKYESGAFEDCVDLLYDVPNIAVVELDDNDIVRSPIIKSILRALRLRPELLKIDK